MTVSQTASPAKSLLLQLTVQFAFGKKNREKKTERGGEGRGGGGKEERRKIKGWFLAAQLHCERYARNAVRGCTYTGLECQ